MSGDPEQGLARTLLVDTHVHIYPCYDLEAFLDATTANFAEVARGHELERGWLGCLVLTETGRDTQFQRLREMGRPHADSPWSFEPQAEPESLLALRVDGAALLLLAGRQAVTREGLEALSIGADAPLAAGRPLDETLYRIRDLGAIPVLPWGFGKWLGKPGQAVRRVIEGHADQGVCLGDNGGRPQCGRRPTLLTLGERAGMAVLPGSDPLPLRSCGDRAGCCGVRLDRGFTAGTVAAQVRDAILHGPRPVRPFGGHVSLGRFLREQSALRLNRC